MPKLTDKNVADKNQKGSNPAKSEGSIPMPDKSDVDVKNVKPATVRADDSESTPALDAADERADDNLTPEERERREQARREEEALKASTEEEDVVNKGMGIFYDGAYVEEVLDDDVFIGNVHYKHARMTDGTTKHVPAELF